MTEDRSTFGVRRSKKREGCFGTRRLETQSLKAKGSLLKNPLQVYQMKAVPVKVALLAVTPATRGAARTKDLRWL